MSVMPVLDSPSAVGDEGRPRAASLAVVSVVLAALVTAVGYRLGQWDLLLSLGVVTGLSAGGLTLLDRHRFVHRFFGHALLTWFGMPFASLVLLAPVMGWQAVAVAGLAVALFGVTATWNDTGDRESLRRGFYAGLRTAVATWLCLTLVLLVIGLAVILGGLPAAGEASPRSALVGFCIVVIVASIGLLAGFRWLPLRELAPYAHRDRVGTTVRWLEVASIALMAVAVVFGGAAFVFSPVEGVTGGIGVLATVAAAVVSSRLVVGVLVGVAGTVFLAGVGARCARAVAHRSDPNAGDLLAATLAGFPLAVLVFVAILRAPPFGLLVVGVVFTAQFLLVFGLAVGLVAGELGLVPDRSGAPAMTAAGLVLSAIAVAPLSTLLAAGCVAGACLAWDLSTFGLGVTAELGHRPGARRLVLVHALVSVAVGSLAVLAVVGLGGLRGVLAGDTVAAVLVATGALVVVATVRG